MGSPPPLRLGYNELQTFCTVHCVFMRFTVSRLKMFVAHFSTIKHNIWPFPILTVEAVQQYSYYV